MALELLPGALVVVVAVVWRLEDLSPPNPVDGCAFKLLDGRGRCRS